jgi:hypothetical protein
MELNKDTVSQYFNRKTLDLAIQVKCQEVVNKIGVEVQEVFKRGKFSIILNILNESSMSISITLDDVSLGEFIFSNEILYSEACLLIELRNIKDDLYDIRKNMKSAPPKKSWIRQLLNM